MPPASWSVTLRSAARHLRGRLCAARNQDVAARGLRTAVGEETERCAGPVAEVVAHRWQALVRVLFRVFHRRQLWSALGVHLRRYTALKAR